MVKNPPAMWETWVQSMGWEDPLEEGMVTHSNIRAWRIPMNRGAWQAAVHGVAKSRTACSVFSKSPINVLSYFHNLKKKKSFNFKLSF